MDKKLLLRLKIFNILIIALLIVFFVGSFSKGFNAGWSVAEYELKEKVHTSFFVVKLVPTQQGIGNKVNTNNQVKANLTTTEAWLVLTNAPKSQLVYTLTTALSTLTIILYAIILVIVWRTTNAFAKGEMITPKTIRRIRKIGLIILATYIIGLTIGTMEAHYLNSTVSIPGYKVQPEVISSSLIFGLVFLVFAEIMTYANRIREEQEFTI